MSNPDSKPAPGETRVARNDGDQEKSEPKLPHERDQSASAQVDGAPVDDARGRKAHDDIERGVVDTDKGPVLEQIDERMKRSATVK
jgi:hypothetical protein